MVGAEFVASLTRTGCEFFLRETTVGDWFCIVMFPSSACIMLDVKNGGAWLQLGSTTRCAFLGRSGGRGKVVYSPGTSSVCSVTLTNLRHVSSLSKASSVGEAARTVQDVPIDIVPLDIL